MLSQEIRRKFLKYYKAQSHIIVPSSPVVPYNDPSLLFVNAGMNQFKDVFLGKDKRDYTRATSTQKCIRVGGKHNDLENVGHTKRHLTFFEMLGNFSFGDYFKKEAIGFAWDVCTHVFDLDPEKIWVSVYKDDDEAFSLWEKHISPSRIVRFGDEENFWAMGDTGPCGPCSELLYDRGENYSNAKTPYEDVSGERFLEFWNLVFMQFIRDEYGNLSTLPKKSIDTGAGLERVIALKMDVENVFHTDILRSLIHQVETVSKIVYNPKDANLAPAFHVIADHIRTLAFAIADGAVPSNVDRGYVLRKILRRAVRYGRQLGLQKPFLATILPKLIETMGEDFPELVTSKSRCEEILTLEEESFLQTLKRGGNLFNQIIETTKKTISGDDAFKLKDTYGFPIEEITLIAKDYDLQVDLKRYDVLEKEAKEKSKKAQKETKQQFDDNFFSDYAKTHTPCTFLGYEQKETQSRIQAIVSNNQFVDELHENQEAILLLDKTPFYAEMGGQAGDMGTISSDNMTFEVTNCISPYNGVIAHVGYVKKGTLRKQDKVNACINEQRRMHISNNHTATHLLHWALEKVLGEHIKQAGSLVEEKYFRLDFNHQKALTIDEIRTIESIVNEKIRKNLPVKSYELTYEEAQKRNDIKQFFGEKYSTQVRVLDIDFSKELCGGTHTSMLGNIGLFKIVKESSIAAGIRRIEAVCGKYAETYIYEKEDLLKNISTLLKTTETKLLTATETCVESNKKMQKEIKAMQQEQINSLVASCKNDLEKIDGISLFAKEMKLPPNELSVFAEKLLDNQKETIVIVACKQCEKCQICIRISNDLVEKNFHAKDLIKAIAPIIKGGGGGKKDSAQAGGSAPENLELALKEIRKIIKEQC